MKQSNTNSVSFFHGWMQTFVHWFDTEAQQVPLSELSHEQAHKVEWARCLPFIFVHIGCLAVFLVGWSPVAVAVCIAAYWLRMFAITAFYHRYFSHRSFKAGRVAQFCFAVLGNTAAQRGPLWWAAHHRLHHKHSDDAEDIHSPVAHGMVWSHLAWFMSRKGFYTDYSVIKDWAKFPELRWLNRFDSVVPVLFGCLMYGLGTALNAFMPELGTSGPQMLVWGFFISTVVLFHGTFTINSLGHLWGKRRFKTRDQSRNNWVLAILTLGEGWHNNHHRYSASARQGFYWYEVDITYYVLKLMSYLGIVSELRPVPVKILDEGYREDLIRKGGSQ